MLLEKREIEVSGSNSILGFSTEGGGAWKIWDRYLTVDGKNAYHIGNICNTCSFFFERLDGANQSVGSEAIADTLNDGVTSLDEHVVSELSKIVPNEKYEVLLLRVNPKLVQLGGEGDYFSHEQVSLWGIDGFWGLPHSPKIQYYRLPDTKISTSERLFQFIVPMFPGSWLDESQIAEYEALIQKGSEPTAIAISVLDIKSPADWEEGVEITSHWCLTHYLLDGHHKTFAASERRAPITLISFLAVSRGISAPEEIDRLVSVLSEANHISLYTTLPVQYADRNNR